MAEQFQNFFVTKLREACDATATTIYVDTVPAITEGTLVLEYANSTKHEIIHFTGVSGYGLTGCTRGLEGTTAQSHSAGTDVRQNLTAGMIDKIINGVITTENIANSAVTTAKINNGAVTADKIDFTTLKVLFSNAEHIGTSERTVASHTIADSGKYFIFLNADINMLGKNPGDGNLSIYQNNRNIQQVFFNNNSLDYFMGGLQLLTITECEAGDVISVKASCQQQEFAINVSGERTNLNLIRIG